MTATAERTETQRTGEPEFNRIPVESLHESPKNPRTHYDETALAQLAENLITVGQITPIIVRERQKGGWEILAGHRRCRAARRAGLKYLDAIVRDVDDRTAVEILNLENLQRDDLNPIEEARGFRVLMEDAGYDIKRLAARMNLAERTVYDRIALLRVIPEAQELIATGVLTPAHGALLSRLTTDDQRRALQANGALLLRENVSPAHYPELHDDLLDVDDPDDLDDNELHLNDARKPATVREFKQWIAEHVRFRPEEMAQTDLAMDLPATAELLEAAEDRKLKVVKITPNYRVPDAARDKERTYGRAAWMQADGAPERYDRYGLHDPKAKPTKTCEHAVVGLVVAGPGRGDAFMVCIAKDKCKIHWAKEMKEREAQRAASERRASPTSYATTNRSDWEAEERKRKAKATKQTAAHEAALRELLADTSEFNHVLQDTRHIDVILAAMLSQAPYHLQDALKRLGDLFGGLKASAKFSSNLSAVHCLAPSQQLQLLLVLPLLPNMIVSGWGGGPDGNFAAALEELGVDVKKHLKAAKRAAKEAASPKKAKVEKRPVKKATKRRAGDVARERKAKASAMPSEAWESAEWDSDNEEGDDDE